MSMSVTDIGASIEQCEGHKGNVAMSTKMHFCVFVTSKHKVGSFFLYLRMQISR